MVFVSKNSTVEIPVRSTPIFRQNLRFSANCHCIQAKFLQQRSKKVERGLENVFDCLLKEKKSNLDKNSLYEAIFPSIHEQAKSKQQFPGDLAFIFPTLFECENQLRRNSINTVATKPSCCFILISALTDETQMYGANKKPLLDLSEYKKQLCLTF